MSQGHNSSPFRTPWPLFFLVHASFVLTGVVTTLLGPILPALSARWSLDDSQAGYLFTAQFLGSMAGVAFSSFLVPRRGFQFSLALGFALISVGVGALSLGSSTAGLILVFCYGVGLGVVIPSANLWVAEVNPTRRAAALNVLNLAWGMGAVAWPPAAALLQHGNHFQPLLYGLALMLGFASFAIACNSSFRSFGKTLGQNDAAVQDRPTISKGRLGPLIGALFFLYVGTESALGGWIASYNQRLNTAAGSEWMVMPSVFWGALLLGRALAPTVLQHVAETTHVLAGLALAVLGVAILLVATAQPAVIAGTGLAGFGLGPVFPITVAIMSQRFASLATRLAGWMFALAGLGGATLPWLVGFLSSRHGGLKTGLLVPLLGSLAMLALYGTGWISSRATHSATPRHS